MLPRRTAAAAPRRRLWPILASIGLVVLLGIGWCGLWYYAASVTARTLAGWVDREAAAGRNYSCGSQGISGFPFTIQVHCVEAAASIDSANPPFIVATKDITVTAQVYRPTVLVGEVTAPLTVADPGQAPSFTATWSRARVDLTGLPNTPEGVLVTLDGMRLDRGVPNGANGAPLLALDSAELNGRIVEGSANDHPVIDVALHFDAASAPTLHALLAQPVRGDLDVVLRGLSDFSPKPWAARFREIQAAGGSVEIKSLRLERTDAVIVGNGTLKINEHGRLDGTIQVAVAGIEQIVPLLGVDRMIGEGVARLTGSGGDATQGLATLDRFLPGLGGAVRSTVIDTLKKMGQPTEIDKRPAIVLPLRVADGSVYLGVIPLGTVPALF